MDQNTTKAEANGRFAIVVDGINIPGYNSLEEAQSRIDNDKDLQKKGAIATKLSAPKGPKKTL